MSPSRPSGSSSTLPGCGSQLYTPSRSICTPWTRTSVRSARDTSGRPPAVRARSRAASVVAGSYGGGGRMAPKLRLEMSWAKA
eukprot:scaffold73908_cov35-Tisochrysis_lutea.AAC.4